MPRIIAVDFFCGAGGLTHGLKAAGIDVILGVDLDGDAEATYVRNNKTDFWQRDLWTLTFAELERFLRKHRSSGELLLFAGCAPCQPFSKLNRSRSNRNEVDLLIRFAEFIVKFRPHFVISENVPQILRHKRVFSRFLKMLANEGYQVSYELVNAKHFNVPQNRLRLVLLASRVAEISIPDKSPTVPTVRTAIAHLPPLNAGAKHENISNHCAMKLSVLNMKRIMATPHDGGDSRSWPRQLQLNCHKGSNGFYDVYGRMSWDKPSPTLTTRCISYSNGRFGHPEQDRAITLREAAALQTFPDDFIFHGTQSTVSRHIGNAVPPKLAEIIGRHISESIPR